MTGHWADGRLCPFDLETTSANPEEARIVQYAIGGVGGGFSTEMISILINPGVEIPDEAAAVHGITTERAQAEGRPADTAVSQLASVVREAIGNERPLAIYNARYDLTVLDRECRRYEVEVPDWSRALVVDPFVIDKFLHRFRKGSRKLADVCAHYGVELSEEEAHDAAADAIAAARLAWVLAKRGEAVARYPDILAVGGEWNRVKGVLPALHGAQVKWAADQAAGLQEYFKRQGKDEVVEPAWPVIPFQAQQELAA